MWKAATYLFKVVPFWWMLLQFASCIVAPRKSQLLELGDGDPQRSNAQLRRKLKDEAPARSLGMVGLWYGLWRCYTMLSRSYFSGTCRSLILLSFWSLSLSLSSVSSNIHSSSSIYVLCSFCVLVALLHCTTENARFLPQLALKGPQQNLQWVQRHDWTDSLPNNIMLRLFVEATKFAPGTDVHLKLQNVSNVQELRPWHSLLLIPGRHFTGRLWHWKAISYMNTIQWK